MIQEICLYLNDQKVDFKTVPQLLFNYKQTDTDNPTIVKNSYTKSLTIEGTNVNNDIFGHIWDLERVQNFSDGVYSGIDFNPLVKSDFTIYANGTIYEKGYFKLNNITKQKGLITYNITLYGGLGSFFYALSYKKDGNGEFDENNRLTLADLDYTSSYDASAASYDFRINKETVNTAWETILGGTGILDDRFTLINFCPAYNGIPDDFDASKVLINTYNLGGGIPLSNPNDTAYGSKNGWVLGETSEDLTEWEANNDLRSYNQRPCINMRRIIEACCNPQNNGGFEVKLDPHFFNRKNPYYWDSWVTLPMLKELDITPTTETTVTDVHLEDMDYYGYREVTIPTETLSRFTNLNMSVQCRLDITKGSPNAQPLYNKFSYNGKGVGGKTEVSEYATSNGIIVQLIAYDNIGNVVATSNAYELIYSSARVDKKKGNLDDYFEEEGYRKAPYVPSYTKLYGKFVYRNSEYVWANNDGKPVNINFTLNTDATFNRLAFKFYTPESYKLVYKGFGGSTSWYKASTKGYMTLFKTTSATGTNKTLDNVRNEYTVSATASMRIVNCALTSIDEEGLFTNTIIRKEDLLTTEYSVCDYLLSYCKLFGLKFYKDPAEDSSDFDLYPEGTIHIVDRDTFFHQDEVVDLNSILDRSREIVITPQSASAKWYSLNTEQLDSECNNEYQKTYGMDYGQQKINTSYNFDASTKELLEKNIFKGAVMVQEKDKYYQRITSNSDLPAYCSNGLKLTYYNASNDTKDYNKPVKRIVTTYPINKEGLASVDTFPKLQFHTENNSASDGSNVLVFLNGRRPTIDIDKTLYGQLKYYLTDDIQEMSSLNDGTACWILTKSATDRTQNSVAIIRNDIPHFSRWIVNEGTGYITHSWDFGKPQSIFTPTLQITDGMSLYEKCWKNYISDLYSVDTRKVSCYCILENQPSNEMLRRFYWFDNSLWVLNSISDWDISSDGSTKCEFIKVQDRNNYKMDAITQNAKYTIQISANEVSAFGGRLEGRAVAQDGGLIMLSDMISEEYRGGEYGDGYNTEDYINPVSSENGLLNFTFEVPANNRGTDRTLIVKLDGEILGDWSEVQIFQPSWDFKFVKTYVDIPTITRYNGVMQYRSIGLTNISITSNVGWITISNITSNSFQYTVDANAGGSREGRIEATGMDYYGRIQKFECIVHQVGTSVE